MSQESLADSQDWNRFWRRPQTSRYGKISWSKRRVLFLLKEYLSENMSVLDAGCGSGFFSAWFADQECLVTALDYSAQAIEKAKQALNDRGRCIEADLLAEDLSLQVQQDYDIIFSDGLLEHFSLKDQDRILKNLSRVLKDGGKIITFVPNLWSPWQLIRPFFMPGIKEKPFTLKSLIAVHQRNGFRIVSSGGLNVLPFRLSPEGMGSVFGMLVYVIAEKI